MATYTARLAAARTAHTAAGHALATALKHVEPPTAELHTVFLTKPEAYAKALHQMADIVTSLPALRAAAKDTLDALSALETDACHRCYGTGVYSGPTSAYRQGKPYCFHCNGTGQSAAARKLVSA